MSSNKASAPVPYVIGLGHMTASGRVNDMTRQPQEGDG